VIRNSTTSRSRALWAYLCSSLLIFSLASLALAQTTVGTGSIVGVVTDSSGAMASAAAVTITNLETGQILHLTTNTTGV